MKLAQLDGIVAFAEVARRRSFTAAAAALEVTPPAVSQAVKALEARLGARLLHRTTRSVGLSEAGERYLARVAPAVAELLAAADDLQAARGGALAGRVRVNAPYVVHAMLLRPVVAGFAAAAPEVQLEVVLDDAYVDIVERGFDLGVRLGDSVQRDMVALPITESECTCLVASPAYAARAGLPATVDELRQHRCIRHRFRSSGAVYRWELRRRGRIVEVEVPGTLTLADSLSMVDAARDGLGIAYTFERHVAADLAAGRLVPVLEAAWPAFPGFHFYCPSRRQLPAAVRAFVDHARAHWAGR